jgi:hypothetical protein
MIKAITSLASLALMCTACAGGDIKSSLQKPAPDEFTVITNPPLSVPPNFDLNAPASKTTSAKILPAESSSGANVKLDRDDQEFLQKLGARSDKGGVKKAIDDEHAKKQSQKREKGFIRKAVDNLNNDGADRYIDAAKEKERIQTNIEEGKPINEGEVPLKENKSTLDKLFN